MTQDPTPYDLLQDAAIEGLQEIVHPYYTPPGGQEYSFPSLGEGVTADQLQQMNLPNGNGILDRGARPYYLYKHDTDAETNQRNTLILGVDTTLGYAEAVISGFYHRLTENMELALPPVTVTTTYYVCLTYDPRQVDSGKAIRVQVYDSAPPTTHGRTHIVLHTVERQPNQLLSQATMTRIRQSVMPTITVQGPHRLPDASNELYGTLAITGIDGGPEDVGHLYRAQYSGWNNILLGAWTQVTLSHGWAHAPGNPVQARRTVVGVQMQGSAERVSDTSETRMGTMPALYRPSKRMELRPHIMSPGSYMQAIYIGANGEINLRLSAREYRTDGVRFDGIIFPID